MSVCTERYIADQGASHTSVCVSSFLTDLLAWTQNSDLQILTSIEVLTYSVTLKVRLTLSYHSELRGESFRVL